MIDWYKPTNIEEMLNINCPLDHPKKCLLMGYLQMDDFRYILKSINENSPNNEIEVDMNKLKKVPVTAAPQAVKLYGQIWHKQDEKLYGFPKKIGASDLKSSVGESSNNKPTLIIIAEIVHFVQPSLVSKLHNLILSVKNIDSHMSNKHSSHNVSCEITEEHV